MSGRIKSPAAVELGKLRAKTLPANFSQMGVAARKRKAEARLRDKIRRATRYRTRTTS